MERRFIPKQPCQKDCPGRTPECKKACERWKAYERAMHEEYKQRVVDFEITDSLIQGDRRRMKAGCFLGVYKKDPRH